MQKQIYYLNEYLHLCYFSHEFSMYTFIIVNIIIDFSYQQHQVFFFFFSLKYESSQVSRTLLSILDNFNTAIVWIALILPMISTYPSLFSRPLGTISRAPTMIGITVTFMFYSFINSLARSKNLSFHFSELL